MHSRHYVALDGLRGVAAIAVMLLHQAHVVRVGFQMPAGLAVDFFFMLSGFVLVHAYGAKLDNGMTWGTYMRARIIRLYPMLLLGICLGGVYAVKEWLAGYPLPHANLATFVATLLLLPVGLLFGGPAFLFDTLVWSLFFEIAASAFYGTRLRHLAWPFPFLSMILILLGFYEGSVTELGRQGSAISFVGGFVRVAVPFAMGAAIYGLGIFQRFPRLPFLVPALALAALLLTPLETGWIYDIVCIFIAFPLLICVGGRASLLPVTDGVCRLLGRLSYPLYLVHLPTTLLVGHFVQSRISSSPYVIVGITVLSSIAMAWVALIFFDEPVRRWLSKSPTAAGRPVIVQR